MNILLIKSTISAFLISIILTPFLIKYSRTKGFIASIDHRSSHDDAIPNTGGIILCFAILIPLMIFSTYPSHKDFSFLLSALAVLLITGVIDDFNPIPVTFKFLGQFIPAIVIVLSFEDSELTIPFIDQIVDLPSVFNYLFWIFFIVMGINAFNLIDGIDGLAISLGIVGSFFYFFEFQQLNELNLVIFAAILIGGLLGLLYFNFSKKNKIFIGDTGSLLIGGLLVFFGLKFISFADGGASSNSFFLVLGSIFIPFMDMIRVALVRIFHGYSPFKADRTHIHHLMLAACKGRHFIATGIIVVIQIGVMLVFQNIALSRSIYYFIALIILAITYFAMVFGLQKLSNKTN